MKRTTLHLRAIVLTTLLVAVSGFTECYKPVGRGTALPKHIKTLAIPPFQNPSLRFKVEQRFTSALVDETIRRVRGINVVTSAEGADAVVNGSIRNFLLRPLVLDDSGRARILEVTVIVALTIRDQTKNKVLFDNQNFVYRGEYEVSGDAQSFFSEEGPAAERLARDFAKSVVSTVLQGF
jgi:hypothetical protein